ncbi:conserved membrane hypothetical protein [Candidatus Methylobacter favarea]|uniref:Uncharacterized protein n=1 Tax=Candidatus Methylobacter favarea TaxID=2707345 RepID=A0A8S0X850_9GAMM|nr:hypothetical protein [Candidatus Methylobacter favarea]CAA9890730.1 conserved membrane hypothetical protein [Candidatus Methylobacter favarea]
MPFFIIISLILSFLVQFASSLQNLLISPLLIYLGTGAAIFSIAGVIVKKIPLKIGYDIFASSTLLVWFAYWKMLFNKDSPIFFFFPLYFAFMTALVSLLLVNQAHKIDYDTYRGMQSVSEMQGLQPWLIMSCVLVTLEFQKHYLLFPVMMTLLIMRFALSSCLEQK